MKQVKGNIAYHMKQRGNRNVKANTSTEVFKSETRKSAKSFYLCCILLLTSL